MRNGARPRRKSPSAAPEIPQPVQNPLPETRSRRTRQIPDEIAGQPNDDVLDLLVRVPLDALDAEPVAEADPVDIGAGAGRDAAAPDRLPAEARGGRFDPAAGFPGGTGEMNRMGRGAAAAIREPAGSEGIGNQGDQIRFARLHLRTGSLLQARSEFEALAACDLLDVPATLDLAEVRWRTGDLVGAGMAAATYLDGDGDEALGFLIAAEAASAEDRVADARKHAGRALERSISLDKFFAGVPRRMTWPESTWAAPGTVKIDEPAVDAAISAATNVEAEAVNEAPEGSLWATPDEVAVSVGAAESEQAVEVQTEAVVEPAIEPKAIEPEEAEPEPATEPEAVVEPAVVPEAAVEPALEPEPVEPEAVEPEAVEPEAAVEPAVVPEAVVEPTIEPEAIEPEPAIEPVAAVPEPVNSWDPEIRAGTDALAAGDTLMAALHLAVALRTSPDSARTVLEVISDHGDMALQLVRGDALRLLGNESDAGQAYASVASMLGTGKPAAEPAAPAPSPTAKTAARTAAKPASKMASKAAAKAAASQGASEPAVTDPDAAAPAASEPAAIPEAERPRSIRWE